MMTKEDAIKIIIREGFLDKNGELYKAFPDVREAMLVAIQAIRGWDTVTEEIESLNYERIEESEEWNKGFSAAIETVLEDIIRQKVWQVDHALKGRIGP